METPYSWVTENGNAHEIPPGNSRFLLWKRAQGWLGPSSDWPNGMCRKAPFPPPGLWTECAACGELTLGAGQREAQDPLASGAELEDLQPQFLLSCWDGTGPVDQGLLHLSALCQCLLSPEVKGKLQQRGDFGKRLVPPSPAPHFNETILGWGWP